MTNIQSRLPSEESEFFSYFLSTKIEVSNYRTHFLSRLPPWLLAVSVLIGVFLVCVLATILYRFGFFQRKRPSDRGDAAHMAAAAPVAGGPGGARLLVPVSERPPSTLRKTAGTTTATSPYLDEYQCVLLPGDEVL